MRKCHRFALALVTVVLSAQPGARVTATMEIRIDGKVQNARKINGRWWSTNNRQLNQTSAGWLWTISGGNAQHLVRFDHHYPVDPAKVRLVDRSMGPDQVRSVLGDPNSVFPSDKPEQHQHWDYYGPNGYKLSIQFAAGGEGIFTASFAPDAKSMPQDVPHLVFRFNGKSVRESFAERQQSPARTRPDGMSMAEWREQLRAEMSVRRAQLGQSLASRSSGGLVEAAPATPAVNSRKLSAAEIASIAVGMTRGRVVELLGEPYSRMAIAGAEPARETLSYHSEAGSTIRIVLVDGKVAEGPR